MATTDGVDPELLRLIDGLVYPSEDDRPVEPIDWPAGPPAWPAKAVVRRLEATAFFGPLVDTTDAVRYAALERWMASHLSDLAAFQVTDGTAEVRWYVVGKATDGGWTGVRAVSVET